MATTHSISRSCSVYNRCDFLVVLWLIVLALGISLIPLMLISSWVRNDVTRLEDELISVQSEMTIATLPNSKVTKLGDDIAQVNQLISTMQTVTVPSGVNWPQVIAATTQYDPSRD